MYRTRVVCGSSATGYSSNTKTYIVSNPTTAAICNDADDLRKAVAKVDISSVPYDFSGFLINHTAEDGRLLFLTTSHPFTRYSPSQSELNNATFTWNEDLNTCAGGSATPVTSVGCSVVVTDGFFTLLELNAAPDMPGGQLYYLGWDINATGSYSSIFQSANTSIKKGRVATTGSPGNVTGSFTSGTDNFSESSGTGIYKFTNWSSGNTEKRGRGAPLLAGSVGKKARGVYIGGTEEECGNGPSYFVYLTSGYTSLLSYLRDGSETNTRTVRMNYCKPSETLYGTLNISIPYQVTGSIVSTQQISDGYEVRYRAGSFVELNDGFYSGTDFVAEIDPCIITRYEIAAKTDDVEYEASQSTNSTFNGIDVKIYPTVIASGTTVKIEASDYTQNLSVSLFDVQGKVVLYNKVSELYGREPYSLEVEGLSSGLYFIKVQGNNISVTQKIIIP